MNKPPLPSTEPVAPAKSEPATKERPVTTPRTTKPRATDPASRARFKRERGFAHGDIPSDPQD